MAFTTPSFLARLTRPFASTSRIGISSETAGAASEALPAGAQRATVAAGCFWGVEHMYRKHFADKGLLDARVGYIGGDMTSPSYRAVCSGKTGRKHRRSSTPLPPSSSPSPSPSPSQSQHPTKKPPPRLKRCDQAELTITLCPDAEATQIIFDPEKVSYRQLLEFFYRMHDPTTLNKQGPDAGSQYRSGIFFHDEEQEKVAKEVTAQVNEKWWHGKVVTEILPAGKWWDAEEYHQLYLDKNPFGYECPSHYLRTFSPLE
jgi:peptide-methionine (S)-S-oxide reductase